MNSEWYTRITTRKETEINACSSFHFLVFRCKVTQIVSDCSTAQKEREPCANR